MNRPTLRTGEIRTGGGAGMPRAPLEGVVAGLAGLLWAAAGLAVAAWAVAASLDPVTGFALVTWALGVTGLDLQWSPEGISRFAMDKLPFIAIGAAVALLLAASNLRKARIAFRAGDVSQDGKGALRLAAIEPRVGRPFDGTIALADAQASGEEYDVTLTARGRGGATAYRAEQKVRTRPGAQGVNLPFRFEVPASAPASGGDHRWRLEFAPAGRKLFGRSAFDVSLGPQSEAEARMASASRPEAHAHVADSASAAHATPQAQGHVDHIEKLYGALGGKLTEVQRARIRAKLSGREAEALKHQLEGLRKIKPEHLKLVKYAAIGAIVVFFVLPFVFSILGMVLAAIFSQ
jgi:hypothetical protein